MIINKYLEEKVLDRFISVYNPKTEHYFYINVDQIASFRVLNEVKQFDGILVEFTFTDEKVCEYIIIE